MIFNNNLLIIFHKYLILLTSSLIFLFVFILKFLNFCSDEIFFMFVVFDYRFLELFFKLENLLLVWVGVGIEHGRKMLTKGLLIGFDGIHAGF